MSVVLYYGSGSPYAWRAWLALAHKGVTFELHTLSFDAGDLETPEFTRLNPRQKVPVLVDDKFVLSESAAIVEYVEERWPQGPRLFAEDVKQRATQRRLIREADAYLAPAVEHFAEQVLFTPADKRNDAALDQAGAALRQELARWEMALHGEHFLTGVAVSAADLSLYPLVALTQRLARRAPALAGELLAPKIAAWAARMAALPMVQATWPPHWK